MCLNDSGMGGESYIARFTEETSFHPKKHI
jgi:hypothetical protein